MTDVDALLKLSEGRDFRLDWTLHGPEGIRAELFHALPMLAHWGCPQRCYACDKRPIWQLRIRVGKEVRWDRAWCPDHVPAKIPTHWGGMAMAGASLIADALVLK